jgi:predicted nucleic acid-binding protein
VIYDSTFLIALERKKTRAAAVDFLARHLDEPARIPVIVLGEIAVGYRSLEELRHNLDPAYSVEPLTEEIAWLASRVQEALAREGQLIGENDTWIAAFALYFHEPLISRDTDYARVVAAGFPLDWRPTW